MGALSGRQVKLAGELTSFWEGLREHGSCSRVVVVAAPPGWGRSAALDHFAQIAANDGPVTLVARVNGRELPVEIGLQAAALRECLADEAARHRAAERLGVDRLSGVTQMGLGVGGLFVSGLAAAVGFLVTGVAVGALGRAWDDSPAGLDGAVARAARAVAALSTGLPVVVIVNNADCLDHDLAVTLVENLVARSSGHVLAVVAVNPYSKLKSALLGRSRMGITEGLVHLADTDPDMGFESRLGLVRELLPGLPGAAARRVARARRRLARCSRFPHRPGWRTFLLARRRRPCSRWWMLCSPRGCRSPSRHPKRSLSPGPAGC